MGEYSYASIRYCWTVGRNVIFEKHYGSKGVGECLFRREYGCERCCRECEEKREAESCMTAAIAPGGLFAGEGQSSLPGLGAL